MPNDAAAEKAGSAEHGNGATVATMTQIRQFMPELLNACGRGTYPGDDEVDLMLSFDLLGAQRDSRITPAEADVRVMAFCLGKLTDFLNEVERASRKL
jgi:hypothetical protein